MKGTNKRLGTRKSQGKVPPKSVSLRIPLCLETLGITQQKPWHLQWISAYMKTHDYKGMTRFQKINQFPWSIELTRKDSLAHNLDRMSQTYGAKHFDFLPATYVLPSDASAFNQICESDPEAVWIVKPSGAAQGRGIYLTQCRNGYSGGGLPPPPLAGNGKPKRTSREASAVPGQRVDTDEEEDDDDVQAGLTNGQSAERLAASHLPSNPIARIAAAKASGVDVDSPVFSSSHPLSPSNKSQHNEGSPPSSPSSPSMSSSFPSTDTCIVSRYIKNPLLIDGFKFDIRIYVAVTSFDPLVVYVHRQGLTRFATREYDDNINNLNDKFMHLTNYSINKHNQDYVIGSGTRQSKGPSSGKGSNTETDEIEGDGEGHKWTISALLKRLSSEGFDVDALWCKVEDLVAKTLLSSQERIVQATRRHVPFPHDNCFQLFGFDIMIDDRLKPWLLEVNLSPSLGIDSPLDFRVKSQVISDLLSLVGCRVPPAITFSSKQSVLDISPESIDVPAASGNEKADHPQSTKSTPATAKGLSRAKKQSNAHRPAHTSATTSRKSKPQAKQAISLPRIAGLPETDDSPPASPRPRSGESENISQESVCEACFQKLQKVSMEFHKKWLLVLYDFLGLDGNDTGNLVDSDLRSNGIGLWINLALGYPTRLCRFVQVYEPILPEEIKELVGVARTRLHRDCQEESRPESTTDRIRRRISAQGSRKLDGDLACDEQTEARTGSDKYQNVRSSFSTPAQESGNKALPSNLSDLIKGYAKSGKTVWKDYPNYINLAVDTHLIPRSVRRAILDTLDMSEEDRLLISRFEQEHARRGQFQRVLPTAYRNSLSWKTYFEAARSSKDKTEDVFPVYLLKCYEVHESYCHCAKEVKKIPKTSLISESSNQLIWKRVTSRLQPITLDRMLTIARSGSGLVRRVVQHYEKREKQAWEFLNHDHNRRYYAGKKPKHLPSEDSRKPGSFRSNVNEDPQRSFNRNALSAMFDASNLHVAATWQSHLKAIPQNKITILPPPEHGSGD
eukprot:gb/GECG01008442.1/.p1 GENE.gb/GECG01008442.1/~~gb/GECG01008442.1/.p1  ORF type:complete len:1016 (+),score=113.35 gb/GECG01008442.1/:1-3048(+)